MLTPTWCRLCACVCEEVEEEEEDYSGSCFVCAHVCMRATVFWYACTTFPGKSRLNYWRKRGFFSSLIHTRVYVCAFNPLTRCSLKCVPEQRGPFCVSVQTNTPLPVLYCICTKIWLTPLPPSSSRVRHSRKNHSTLRSPPWTWWYHRTHAKSTLPFLFFHLPPLPLSNWFSPLYGRPLASCIWSLFHSYLCLPLSAPAVS